MEDPFVVVAPTGELPDGPYPTGQLNGRPLVGYPPSSCQPDVEDGLHACGVEPTFVFRTYDNGAQLAMVRAGMGWAVMPSWRSTPNPAIDIRSLTPAIAPRQICVAWRRDRTCPPSRPGWSSIACDVAGDLRQLPAA